MEKTTKTPIGLSLPGNSRCWMCGAGLQKGTLAIRMSFALCSRCAVQYDRFDRDLPLRARHPKIADRIQNVHGVICWCPESGDPELPQGLIMRRDAESVGYKWTS